MATSGVMADFARLPNQRKVMVFVVIGLALGLLYYQFVYKGLSADVDAAVAENKSKSAANKAAADNIEAYDKLKLRMKELTRTIQENQTALPTESEVPHFFETLERKVKESGVEIIRWKKANEEPVDTFVKVPVEIEIVGTYMQIKRFFASLVQKNVGPVKPVDATDRPEEKERVVSIENLSLTTPVVRNREIFLTARFVAVTYRQEDGAVQPQPASPGKPGAAPAAGAPAKPATPTQTPPLPSAGTPAGAKARTEQSLDKGDAINRNATGVDEAKTPTAGSGSARLKGGI